MKKAKVSNGIVQIIWPFEKTLPDGTVVVKEFKDGWTPKGLPIPDYFVDVPDDVRVNWIWDGEKYRPRTKDVEWLYDGEKFVSQPRVASEKDYFFEVLAEKLGTTIEALKEEARIRRENDLANT